MSAQNSVRKPRPWWQQATALVTVSTGGVITGLNFAPGTPATMTSPNGLPMHLLALDMSGKGDLGATTVNGATSGDAALRPAIVNIARHYFQLAQTKSPAEMEALIWGAVSTDGTDHGPSCAAFASLTLGLAAQAVGQQSWVTGGDSYPWPVHSWADPRVDENPDSPTITSVLQDAQAHDRWHPLGDGYTPLPGDWVLFNEHVEVVTSYADGVLHTIGANSLPGYTVNAHTFSGSLADDGIAGFVDNGHLVTTASAHPAGSGAAQPGGQPAQPGGQAAPATKPVAQPAPKPTPPPAPNGSGPLAKPTPKGQADIPGLVPVPQGPSGQPGASQPKPADPKPAQACTAQTCTAQADPGEGPPATEAGSGGPGRHPRPCRTGKPGGSDGPGRPATRIRSATRSETFGQAPGNDRAGVA